MTPPISEYSCTHCEFVEEVIEPLHSPKTRVCPYCGHMSQRIPSICSFSIPGFKHGQMITEDDCGTV